MATLQILPGELNFQFFKRDAARIKLTFSTSIAGLTWASEFLTRTGTNIFSPTITTEGTTILYIDVSQVQMALLAAQSNASWYLQETTADRTYFAGEAAVLERV